MAPSAGRALDMYAQHILVMVAQFLAGFVWSNRLLGSPAVQINTRDTVAGWRVVIPLHV